MVCLRRRPDACLDLLVFGQGSTLRGLPEAIVALSFLLVIPSIAIATGIAIFRYRLYDIDRIINRTLVYGSLTLMLALVYFGGVTATQTLFRYLTGQEQQLQLAVVVSTLAIAALFTPLRRRIQSFIDRRFYRRKYDARKTLEAFSTKLRDETDLNALERRPGRGGEGDDAAFPRLAVAAPHKYGLQRRSFSLT